MSITRVNTNFDAIFATNQLKQTEMQLQNAMRRISSGKRINYASDDPAGIGQLVVARAALGGSRVAQQNAQETLSMLQFADGVMQNFEDKLIELRDMAMKGANDATLSTGQRAELNTAFTTAVGTTGVLGSTRMAEVTWNNKNLFDGSFTAVRAQYGGVAEDNILITIEQLDSSSIGAAGTDVSAEDLTSAANAASAIATIDAALEELADERSNIGSAMQQIQYGLEEQMTYETNMASAVSSIGDADMAAEISKLTTSQIIAQSGAAMLGQANIHSQTLLNILL